MSMTDITSWTSRPAALAVLGLAVSLYSTAPATEAKAGSSASPIAQNNLLLLAQSDENDTDEVSDEEGGEAVSSPEGDVQTTAGDAVEEKQPPLPEILTDLNDVPFPVRKMRELILEAARSGDIEKLRRYIGYGDDVTMLSLGGHDEDPIAFLKELSGDSEGHEILAIITEILESPFVKIEEIPGQEMYVWPYYYAYPFDKLTPKQRVQLFRIITYGDYEEMASFGSYIFYRLGITPEGRWRFLVAGD